MGTVWLTEVSVSVCQILSLRGRAHYPLLIHGHKRPLLPWRPCWSERCVRRQQGSHLSSRGPESPKTLSFWSSWCGSMTSAPNWFAVLPRPRSTQRTIRPFMSRPTAMTVDCESALRHREDRWKQWRPRYAIARRIPYCLCTRIFH
jgi:hypothetical protein